MLVRDICCLLFVASPTLQEVEKHQKSYVYVVVAQIHIGDTRSIDQIVVTTPAAGGVRIGVCFFFVVVVVFVIIVAAHSQCVRFEHG